ncbi:uncharacterized protein BJ171DRAFT_176688 [Polychytrium aggregatum]|uniref:uncharacterized protein n=1 Tax=Polychytrium aggregatum TaxID=110093 RepID=UPI0022FDE87E|nr:uncharacterized protein BJ171DRAFT_176688 [Polychytrium aggregatum]KAI9202532.1 hypothetical protein BJ171DRAFT_176688 [Polychytrium aggregatum]
MCWFNGSPDKSLPTFALWPPTIRTYHIITPRLLQTPAVDLGYSKVTARLRRAVLLISSLQYRCYYCAAHTAATGDMLHGSWRSQVRSSSRESDYRPIVDPFDSRLSEYESEALFLATAASAIPSKVTPDLKRRVRAHFKGEEYEQIACITAFIAWTNAITDSVGMELEAAALLWAEEQISDAGWEGRRHAPETYDPASLKSRIELKREAETQETTPHRGFGRVMDLLRLLRSTQGANSAEAAWLKGFPSGHTQLNKWLKYTLGFVPEYLGNMTNKESKRAVCFALWQFLLRPKNHVDPCVTANGVSEWSHGAKVLLWYVYTTKTGNLLLQGHAAFLAQQMRVPHHILSIAAAGGCIGDPRVDIALDFIRTSASLKRTYTGQLSLKLFESVASPAGVMELVSSLGLFNMLHRLSAILAPDPPRFEPEVKYFLSTVGAGLGLDPSKAGPQRDQDAENPLQFLL